MKMSVAERRLREKAAVRNLILEAASALILEQGYENLSIRKIAERIEYAPSTIYLYFKDKFEIISTICLETFEQLACDLDQIAAGDADALTRLRRGLRHYIDFGLSHPSHYQVTFGTRWPEHDGTLLSANGMDQAMRAFGTLVNAILAGIDAGTLKSADPMMTAQAIWTSIHGLTSLLISMGDDKHFPWAPKEQLIEHTLDVLLRGIAA